MNAKRVVFLAVLLACLLPALAVAVAQDDSPAKGEPLGAGLTREEAVAAGLDTTSWFGGDESEPNNNSNNADDIYPYIGWVTNGEIGFVGDSDYFEHIYGIGGGETLHVAVAASRFGSNLDSVLYLYKGSTLLVDNDDNWGLDSYLEYTSTGGQGGFDLVVRDYEDEHGGSDHWYQLYTWITDADCEEPNNTKGKAKAIGYTSTLTCPHIDRDGDVDWYKFEGKKGDVAQVTMMTTEIHGTVESDVKLYDGGKVLAQCSAANWGPNDTNCYLQAPLPKTGTYYIMVRDAHNKGGGDKRYWLGLTFEDPYEPNNDEDHAWPIGYGQTVRAHTSSGGDWYKFYGWAGDVVTMMGSPGAGGSLGIGLLDTDRTTWLADNYEFSGAPRLNALSYELTHNGWYYVWVYDASWVDYYPGDQAYELTVGPVTLMGTTGSGKSGELKYDRSDILAYFPDSDTYTLYFDGSANGIKAQLTDFDVQLSHPDEFDGLVHSQILMTFGQKAKLPTVGLVQPQDVITFHPWTAPWQLELDMYLDGSDIGLTSGAEAIDALAYAENYDWYGAVIFSTTGRATITSQVGNLTVEDEDLVACWLTQTGWDTEAWCYLMMDGSLAGLPKSADIATVSMPVFWEDVLHLTFTSPVTIDGVKYLPNEVAVCEWIPDYDCEWRPKYWSGNSHGLKGKKLDGFDWPWPW